MCAVPRLSDLHVGTLRSPWLLPPALEPEKMSQAMSLNHGSHHWPACLPSNMTISSSRTSAPRRQPTPVTPENVNSGISAAHPTEAASSGKEKCMEVQVPCRATLQLGWHGKKFRLCHEALPKSGLRRSLCAKQRRCPKTSGIGNIGEEGSGPIIGVKACKELIQPHRHT